MNFALHAGNWNAEKGRELTRTEGNVWVAEVPLKAGQTYEFKLVVYNSGTKAQKWVWPSFFP